MTSVNINDAGIDARLDFVRTVLRGNFGLIPRQIEAIAYEQDFPFPYNNFIYVVDVDPRSVAQRLAVDQPGTQQIPPGTGELVVRLSNPLAGYNDRIRIENEVAALSIARDAMSAISPNLCPRVFGWGSASNGKQGWIAQEYMPGKPLAPDFPGMSDENQQKVLGHMADVLGCLQRFDMPESVTGYGGLTFSPDGSIESTEMSIMKEGPFSTYEDLVMGTIRSKLAKADQDAVVDGWRTIRPRLDRFLAEAVGPIMKEVEVVKKVLVHADFSTDNVLYDPETMRLTAVLDLDFAHVGTVADDFFRSLGHGLGRLPDPRDGAETLPLCRAMLQGFPDPLPPPTEDIQWPAAKAWNDALQTRDLYRPSTIPGIQGLSELFWLSSQLLPWKITNEVVVRQFSKERLRDLGQEYEESLSKFLEDRGY